MKNILFIIAILFSGIVHAQQYDFIVAQDGSGDFKTVQEAFMAVPDLRKAETTIYIKSGVYKEKLVLPASKNNVTIIGEDVENTILTYDDFASKKNKFGENIGTSGSSSFFLYGDGFTAKNITFENSAGPVGQAVAVRIDGDKVHFFNCKFLGNQDTLYPHGKESRQYYKNCYIEGTVDFIFGWSTALFENCEIKCKRDGYITAASTGAETPFGFVFKNCKVSGTNDVKEGTVYLGRPWRDYAKTVFIECDLSEIIRPLGWHDWNKPQAHKTTFYAEYNNTGAGADLSNRVDWMKKLTKEEAAQFIIENIFRDEPTSTENMNYWNPNE